MLPRPLRLHADKDYARLFSKGRAFHGRGLTVKAIKNDLPGTRVGFVVSTKVAKKANVRNLVKRRMRDVVRRHFSALVAGVDIAIMAKPESKEMSFVDFQAAIVDTLWKAGLLTHR